MSKFRYARANGQFLESKFVNPVASATTQNFRLDQSYDLTKSFVSQSAGAPPSFVTDTKLTGYTPGSILGWWRLGNEIQTTLDAGTTNVLSSSDSSGNGYTLTAPSGREPTRSSSVPSNVITNGSVAFNDTNNDCLVARTPGASSAFSFSDGTNDLPFSFCLWFRPHSSSADNGDYLLIKGGLVGGNYEYILRFDHSSRNLALWLRDDTNTATVMVTSPDDAFWPTPGTTHSQWMHIAVTYDGRGGEKANQGIKMYKDGTLVHRGTGATTDYVCMTTMTDQYLQVGGHEASTALDVSGYISDVAIYNRVLSSTDIANLYGANAAGAYHLVREFSNISPDNDSRMLGVETRSRGFNVSALPPDIGDQFKQGINVNNFDELLDYTSFKIRPNSGLITTFDGVDVNQVQFNDCLTATTNLVSGSSYSQVTLGSAGRLSQRISHMREQRDLGQRAIYNNNEVFEDTLDLDPIAIIQKHPLALILPTQLVCQTSDELLDGAIEPLIIRAKIDGSSIDMPYYTHDLRSSLGGMTDPWLRSYVIVDGKNLKEDSSGTAPFLDSTETFGKTDMPGAFSDDFAKLPPFTDYLNDRDKEYTTNGVSSTVADVLIHSSSWTDNDDRTYDKMAAHGFVFDNDPIGFDSIAFGGLKK